MSQSPLGYVGTTILWPVRLGIAQIISPRQVPQAAERHGWLPMSLGMRGRVLPRQVHPSTLDTCTTWYRLLRHVLLPV